jgi:hypothetical protein
MKFKEECWFLYGIRIYLYDKRLAFIGYQKYHTMGAATSVEMDYSQAINPKVIGWYHTHPGTRNIVASAIDNATMRSWVKAMYKAYLCGIRCGSRSSCYCYYVGGINKEKTTIVKKIKVNIKFFGSFFIGITL